MKTKVIINHILRSPALFLLIISQTVFANFNDSGINYSDNISSITKYTLNIPLDFNAYTLGFSTGLGSSITFKGADEEGNIELYSICDRGPNYSIAGTLAPHTIIFPRPDFSPFIGVITITSDLAILTNVIPLKIDGQLITGLPPIAEEITDFNSFIPTDSNFKPLSPDPKGLDLESLDMDHEGNFWVGDEYHPALIKINGITGEIKEVFTPDNGLPKILKEGPTNRGFEALAITPNGKIYLSMESILIFNGETKKSSNFIRIIEFNPETNETRTFAYPFDKFAYQSPLCAKIGDLAAIDDTHFLIVEQGKTVSGMRNFVYVIDISDATDISDKYLSNGQALEYGSIEDLSNIEPIKKYKLFNAREYHWSHDKLEGIAIIDSTTIAITNDNDFGFSLSINGINSEKVDGYEIDYTTQKLFRYNKESKDSIDIHINSNAITNIWIIKFTKNLLDFKNLKPNDSALSIKSLNTKSWNNYHIDEVPLHGAHH